MINGRGQAGAGSTEAGDGIRLERTRVSGALNGSTRGLFTGRIENSGFIGSESDRGTVSGFRTVNRVSSNSRSVNIDGNGLVFNNSGQIFAVGGTDIDAGVRLFTSTKGASFWGDIVNSGII